MDWLDSFLKRDKAVVYKVMPLWGLKPEMEIELRPDIKLIPFTKLRASHFKDRLERPYPSVNTPSFAWSPPTAAVLLETNITPLFYKSEDPKLPPFDSTTFPLLQELRRILSLVSPCAIMAGEQWSEFQEPDLAELGFASGGLMSSPTEIQPIQLRTYGPFDADRAVQMVQGYFALAGQTHDRLRLAVARFDQSMRRHEMGDAAVELAIALDALLGDGQGELVSKISLRSALLAGSTKLSRLEIRSIVTAIYDVRSRVVHTGKAPTNQKVRGREPLKIDDLIAQGTVIAANIIAAAIRRGDLPDWFEEEVGPD